MLHHISHPTLLIREQICRANIRRMADKATAWGVIFRPHFKTHQSIEVGEWFREHGVNSITVSSISMARDFASAGWDDITIAFPVNLREIHDYNSLSKKIQLNLLADSIEAVNRLASEIETETGIFLEIDTGYGRSGLHYSKLNTLEQIIKAVDEAGSLSFKGFLTHSGNTYSATKIKEIEQISTDTITELNLLKAKYIDKHPDIIVSIGDTPSCSILDDLSGADEIRPGNFVYYDLMQYYLGSCTIKDIAVSVACPISGIYPDRNEIVIYGGAIHLSKEYLEQHGKIFGLIVRYTEDGWTIPIPDTYLISISQEHGIIRTTPEFISTIRHGDLLGILPVHSCLTANLLKKNVLII